MTLRRADIVAALMARLQTLDLFDQIEVDADEVGAWRDLGAGLGDSSNLLSGRFAVTIDSGPEDQWEGVRDCTVVYSVNGVDRNARATQRDLAVPAVEALLAADRTLGTEDPQVWAEVGETIEDDNAPLAAGTAVSLASIGINVTYVAASAAG